MKDKYDLGKYELVFSVYSLKNLAKKGVTRSNSALHCFLDDYTGSSRFQAIRMSEK